jgi:hypothetical protein
MEKSIIRFAKLVSRITLATCLLVATSCSSSPPAVTPLTIRVQYSFATQPWLANLNTCAGKNVVASELRSVEFQNLQITDMVMRLGPSDNQATPAYQIGTEDILVIVNHKNSITKLTSDQVRLIFSGQTQTWKTINGTESLIQVWTYPSGEDVQQIFLQTTLVGTPVTSHSRLANEPDEMVRAVSSNVNAIGILPGRRKTKAVSSVFTAASKMPVLAITPSTPPENLAQTLACLQK